MNITDVILVLSQSQYDRRVVGTSPVAEVDGTVEGIQMLNPTANAFQNFKYGTNTGSFVNTTSNYGPAEIALKQYRDWIGVDQVNVVQVSKSGVSLHYAGNSAGAFYVQDTKLVTGSSKMWDIQKSRIEQAYSLLGRQGKYINWKAILLAQGESDKGSPYNAAYGTNFAEWVRRTRNLLRKNVPMHFIGVPSGTVYYDATVRTAQTDFETSDGNCHFLDTNGFSMQGDNVHYDATGVQDIADDIDTWLRTL